MSVRTHIGGAPIEKAFARIVAVDPEAVALRCGERSMSYAALDSAANQLAHYRIRRGIVAAGIKHLPVTATPRPGAATPRPGAADRLTALAEAVPS